MAEQPQLQVRCNATLGGLRLCATFAARAAWTVLFGPSGSGKSSLLRLVAGLWSPADASVLLRGEDVTHVSAHLRRVGLVAQKAALFPHMSVLGNICFGAPEGQKYTPAVDGLLDLLDLQPLRGATVGRLSGGEYQRVALARALAAQPRLLLLDEVFTGMHMQQRDTLLCRVHTYCGSIGLPVLAVTHDVAEACLVSDEVLRLEAGRICGQGPGRTVLAAERASLLLRLGDAPEPS